MAKKVMDIAKPGALKGDGAASARPVIVTNRVVVQDPMVKSDSEQAATTAPAAREKTVIKPLTEEDKAADKAADATKVEIKDEAKEETKVETKEAEKEGLLDIHIDPLPPEAAETEDAAPEPAEETAAEQPAKDPKPAEESKPEPPPEPPEKPKADDDQPEEDLTSAGDGKRAAAEVAEAKKQEEVSQLVETKEYFLPINSVERRRSRVVAIVGALVIILLGAAWLNIAMDAGFVTIPGVEPLTHFFNAT